MTIQVTNKILTGKAFKMIHYDVTYIKLIMENNITCIIIDKTLKLKTLVIYQEEK